MTRTRFYSLAAFALLSLSMNAPAAAQSAVSLTSQSPRSVSGIRFRFIADGPVRGGFALAGGRLLFGTEAGTVYAIDSESGQLRWKRRLGAPVSSTPAVLGTTAFLTTWDNGLHAVDIATGRERWRRDLGRTIGPTDYWEYYVSSPVISGARLYVGSGGGKLFALDAKSGREIWSTDLRARIRSTPAIAGNVVLAGTNGGHVIAVNRATGARLWSFATVGAAHDYAFKHNDTRSVTTSPIVIGDTVIAGGRDGNIYGIDLRSGVERWRETHDGGSWILGLAGDLSAFYSGSGSALIVQAADPRTGKEYWRSPTDNAMFGGLAKAGDVLVSNGSAGNLFTFDGKSGAVLWRLHLSDMTHSSPLVATGAVFTGSDDGSVLALDTSTEPAPPSDRYVYTYDNEPARSFFWFKPEVVAAMKGAFAASGFKPIGNASLAKLLEPAGNANERKVVVIADTRLPADVGADQLRRFVSGGGILVLTGLNPAGFSFDEVGAPAGEDKAKASAAFGVDPPDLERDHGNNVSTFTPEAARFGLSGQTVAVRWARPDQVSLILARDRSGMATAWLKRFPGGGMVINLPVPRLRPTDITRLVNAVEIAATAKQ